MSGLCANAAALAEYLAANYPGIKSIGGVRPDRLPDHPSGHAIDVMVGNNTALGYEVNNYVRNNGSRWGLRYTMWQVANHYDHVHITVS